eukprot:scaffold101386_cov54-Phaeocystis_antarctica.AAC.1
MRTTPRSASGSKATASSAAAAARDGSTSRTAHAAFMRPLHRCARSTRTASGVGSVAASAPSSAAAAAASSSVGAAGRGGGSLAAIIVCICVTRRCASRGCL